MEDFQAGMFRELIYILIIAVPSEWILVTSVLQLKNFKTLTRSQIKCKK